MENPNYYAIIPADVRYSNLINANEKLLYAEITSLCNAKGYCWASNNYFAELYNCTPQAISKWINNLKKNNFIKIDYNYKLGSKEIEQRNIYIGINNELIGINNGSIGINIGLRGSQHRIKDNNKTINNKKDYIYKQFEKKEYNVLRITDEEHSKLLKANGKEKLILIYNKLVQFSQDNPKRFKAYKSHYSAINKWVVQAVENDMIHEKRKQLYLDGKTPELKNNY